MQAIKQLWFFLNKSIFFKLLMIFFVTAILLGVLVTLSANYLSDPERFIHKKVEANISYYTGFLLKEIGNPPDYQKANELASQLGLEIQIKHNGQTWQSQGFDLPRHSRHSEHTLKSDDEMQLGHSRGYSYIKVKKYGMEVLFAINHKRFSGTKVTFFLLLGLIIIVVISFAYTLVSWQFRPIKWLTRGVEKVSQGDFEFKLPVRKHDEIGELAAAFNTMSTKIQTMLKDKEQLLLDVSHELRSPITRMKIGLELMPDSPQKQTLQDDLKEMEIMITELLESARLDNPLSELHKTQFDILQLIKHVTADYKSHSPGIVINAPKWSVMLKADKNLIQRVLHNILENAKKYSAHQSKSIEVNIRETQDSVEITVRDFGEGIPERDIEHIFEPFYRVDKSRNARTGGYGLGLSLCKKIMQAHKGKIQVKSQLGQSTEVSLSLPK